MGIRKRGKHAASLNEKTIAPAAAAASPSAPDEETVPPDCFALSPCVISFEKS